MVEKSPSKKCVILTSGTMVMDKENKLKFELLVDMDGRQKNYKPNKTTMRNLQAKYGNDSAGWVGKALSLSVGMIEGKKGIIGLPI